MAIVPDVLNCGTGSVGTYFDGCEVSPKDFTKAFLKSPSLKIDLATDTFDEATRALYIKKGLLVPLNDALQIADVPAKNNYQTFPNKKKKFISQGLLEFVIGFEANVCLVKALHSLKKKKWELLLLDSEGKLFFDNNGGRMDGFEISDFSVDNETVNDGGSKIAMVEINLQLSQNGTDGYNTRKSYLVSDETNDYYNINGVQDVKIETDTLSIANLLVTVMSGCDGSTPVLGLTTPNFAVTNATTGTDIPVTVVEIGNGQYKINGATTGARTIKLFDLINNLPVADIEEQQFFKSNVVAATLAA